MVSIGATLPPHSQTKASPQDTAFGLQELTGKGASGPESGSHLAFVPPRDTNPNLFRGVLNLLEAGIRGAGALVHGTGSLLLQQLLSDPTADTHELVRTIRGLEARGLDIDSAIALRELPNGDLGVYAVPDPDDPFPDLLAIIKPDGAIVTRRAGPAGPDPLEGNPGGHPDAVLQGPDGRPDGWRAGAMQAGEMQAGEMQAGEMPRIEFPPMASPMDRESFNQRFVQMGLQLGEMRERFDTPPHTVPTRSHSLFDPKTPSRIPDYHGSSGAPELPGSGPLHAGSAGNDDAARRLQEALEAARHIVLNPGGFFGDGVDPRDEMFQRYGWIGLFAYDLAQAETSSQDGSGGSAVAAGTSTSVANYLRLLPAEVAATIINHLADRLDAIPEIYRDALGRALDNGDPQDPAIQRASQLLSEADAGIHAPSDGLAPLTPEEEAQVTRYVQAGTFTRATFDQFRAANPDMAVRDVVLELAMHMQGFATGRLNSPDISAGASAATGPMSAHEFGVDPGRDAEVIEELDRFIALGTSGFPLGPRDLDAAGIAEEIRENLDTIDHALVMTDSGGRPMGMVTYTNINNPDDPSGPRILFIEKIISFTSGQGIGLRLLQEAFDRSEGIMGLISLPGASELYMNYGAEEVPRHGAGPDLFPYLIWTDPPERIEQE